MMMGSIFRQGNGEVKKFRALGPISREDGEALAISEIANYIRYVEWLDSDGTIHPTETMVVNLVEDASTPEYDGEFDEIVDIDAIGLGLYKYWYRTVDTDGRESVDSEVVSFEVASPLTIPLPPTDISIV